MRKGISPLIAAVMLIAFTVAVAALLTTWVKTFTQERAEQVGVKAEEEIECTWAGLTFLADPYYNKTDPEGLTIYVSVENTGTVTLGDFKIVVISKDRRAKSYSTGPGIEGVVLQPGDVATLEFKNDTDTTGFNNTDVLDGGKIRVTTETCPAVYYEKQI